MMRHNSYYNTKIGIIIILFIILTTSIPLGLIHSEDKIQNNDTEMIENPKENFEIYKQEELRVGKSRSGYSKTWPGSWAPKTPMLTERLNFAIGVVNNKIYAIGGWFGTEALNINEEYDPTTDTWTTKAPMPTARQGLAIAVVNNKIYAIGGCIYDPNYGIGWRSLATVECYNPSTNSWSSKTNMPTPRTGMASGVVNNKIYVIGGHLYNYDATDLDVNEEYDPINDSWTSKARLPYARTGLAIGVINNHIYAIGGQNKSSVINVTEVYNPVTNTWTNKTPMPTARSWFAMGVINNEIYAVGGFREYSSLNVTEKFDPSTNSWTEKAPLPTSRFNLAIGAVNNLLYAIGGHKGDETNVTEEFNPNPPHHIVISPLNATIIADQQQQFNATIYDKYNNTLYLDVKWEVANGTIDENGLFHPYCVGNWTIYANFSYDSTTITENITITVNPGDLYKIKINPNKWIMYLNETKQFTAIGYDVYNNNVIISPIWSTNCNCSITQNGLLIVDTVCLGIYSVYANKSNIQGIVSLTILVNESADTDSDGMLDWWEVEYSFDPFKSTDSNFDMDLDGLTNVQEFLNGTNPLKNDTDGDNLGDSFELIFSKTNPTSWDSNGNGIGDGLEFLQKYGYSGGISTLPNNWIGMTISWSNYTIFVATNSSVLTAKFDKENKKLNVFVSGINGTIGKCNISVPKTLINSTKDISLWLDNKTLNFTLTQNKSYFFIDVLYTHSTHELTLEFSQKGEKPVEPIPSDPIDDEKDLPTNIYLIILLIVIIIIIIISIVVIQMQKKNGNNITTALPPEKLSILLEKEFTHGKMTDETYTDIKSLLEKYQKK
jgi:N-acetylneuraminic acid mutarotase